MARPGRPPLGERAMTSTERSHRHRAKLRASKPATKYATKSPEADATRLPAEIAALKAERDQLRAQQAKLEKELAEARARIEQMRQERLAFRFGGGSKRQEAKPKAEKPPLPPDEARDGEIKRLRTRVRKLTAEMRHIGEWHWQEMARVGGMTFATMSAIAKPLMPDHRKHLTRAELDTELDEACKQFTAWKADKDSAKRKGR
jgi:hypothetical protein